MTLAERLAQPDVKDLPDWQAADVLNSPDPALPTKYVDVDTADARGILLATAEWPAIVIAAEGGSGVPAEVRALCILVRDTLTTTKILQLSIPSRLAAIQMVLSGLMAASLITQNTTDLLLALATKQVSWAEANNMKVDARTVGLARGGV